LPEIAADAALFFDPLKSEDIGLQMAHVYKDEQARSLMIERGLARASSFSWSQSCQHVREILHDAVSR
jgi:glycosyltransferase involved in cell wall biosynthesis